MNKITLPILLLFIHFNTTVSAEGLSVQISKEISSVDVIHNGKPVTIQRNQSSTNLINPDYAITSRKCPPFCIQPGQITEGVETIGELELLDYLKRSSNGEKDILVIDSRTADWV